MNETQLVLNKERLFKLIQYNPHPAQWEIHNDKRILCLNKSIENEETDVDTRFQFNQAEEYQKMQEYEYEELKKMFERIKK